MHVVRFLTAVALAAWWPAVAAAQTTTTTDPAGQTTVSQYDDTFFGPTDSHWIGSAFIGGNFGDGTDEGSMDFGGSVGYLWRGVFGGEFQANFSPDFNLEPTRSALLGGGEPWISSYMANAVLALPMGAERRFQPYVSGGLGALTLNADELVDDDDFEPDDSRAAGNLGFGVLGYLGNIGIRGDVRWFRGFEGDEDGDPVETPGEAVGNAILSDLQFWRANIGVAFRW
jgi:hypothetical protein